MMQGQLQEGMVTGETLEQILVNVQESFKFENKYKKK
jgi:hypothetical protein